MLHMFNLSGILRLQMHRHYTQRLHTYYRIAHILFMLALHSFISHAPAILCSILHPPQPTPQGGRGDTINTLLIQPRPTPTHKTRGLGDSEIMLQGKGGTQDLDIVKSWGVFRPTWHVGMSLVAVSIGKIVEISATHFETKPLIPFRFWLIGKMFRVIRCDFGAT